ncbi:MAG TPA: DUF1269 domain-containing protein [Ktedonobacterales bacterium]|nr:DUF1269 domain-containing protein [Ktedonobacterales bacterium]
MNYGNDIPVHVVLAAFNDETGAEKALSALNEAQRAGVISIRNAAALWKDENGKFRFKETADMHGGKGAAIGGVIGGVVGLIVPPSILASATVGAAIGGLSAKLHDAGFPDDRLRQVGADLKPNTSALIAVVEQVWVRDVEEQLRQYGADIATEAVRADIAEQLEAEDPVAGELDDGRTAGSDTSTASTSFAADREVPPPGAAPTGGTSLSPS